MELDLLVAVAKVGPPCKCALPILSSEFDKLVAGQWNERWVNVYSKALMAVGQGEVVIARMRESIKASVSRGHWFSIVLKANEDSLAEHLPDYLLFIKKHSRNVPLDHTLILPDVDLSSILPDLVNWYLLTPSANELAVLVATANESRIEILIPLLQAAIETGRYATPQKLTPFITAMGKAAKPLMPAISKLLGGPGRGEARTMLMAIGESSPELVLKYQQRLRAPAPGTGKVTVRVSLNRAMATQYLIRLGAAPEDVAELLTGQMNSEFTFTQSEALRSLVYLGRIPGDCLPAFRKHLNSENKTHRGLAMGALIKCGSKGKDLLSTLESIRKSPDSNSFTQLQTAKALAASGDSGAIRALCDDFWEQDGDTSSVIAEALEALPGDKVFEALEQIDPRKICKATGPHDLAVILFWLKHEDVITAMEVTVSDRSKLLIDVLKPPGWARRPVSSAERPALLAELKRALEFVEDKKITAASSPE